MRRLPALSVMVLALVGALLAAPTPASAATPPNLWLDSTSLQFGQVTLGSDSAVQTVTVHGAGPGTLTGLTIGAPGDDDMERTATTCGSTLAAGATCTISFRYSPSESTAVETSVLVSASGGAAQSIDLVGAPNQAELGLSLSPTGFDFGPVAVGTDSTTRTMTITNRSGSSTTFTLTGASTPPAPFSSPSTGCTGSPISLAAGASCAITYRFHPTAAGPASKISFITVNESGYPLRSYPLELRGHGGTSGAKPLTISPTRLDFGPVPIGTTAPTQNVTVTNTSSSSHKIDVFNGGATGFGGTQNCQGQTLAPGGTCTFNYAAAPTQPGLLADDITIGIETPGTPYFEQPISLTANGTGFAPAPVASPGRLHLGPSAVGSPTATRTVTVRNNGTAAMTSVSIAQSGTAKPQFTLTGTTCGSTLATGASCTFSVRYTPTSATARLTAHYVVTSSASDDPEVAVTGGPRPSVNAAFLDLATVLFLRRVATSGELAATVPGLDAGTTTRRAAVVGLANSPEWVEGVVQRLYLDTLDREGDPGGVAFWVGRIRSGRFTVAQAAAQFYASSEYYNGIGGGSDTSWVTDLYVKLLERSPDAGGLAYWVGQTASKGRPSVAGRMYQSQESRRARVTNLYNDLLFRNPDTGGRNYWAGRIEREGDIALATELASSSEFVRLAQRLDGNYG